MSTGKRLAKRSIIGTRVCAPGDDGKYYSGVISAVNTPSSSGQPDSQNGALSITPQTRYRVHFDPAPAGSRAPDNKKEYLDRDLIGPGFSNVCGAKLVAGQKVFLTHNGREVQGSVIDHREHQDEVEVVIHSNNKDVQRLCKRIDEVRLLESRKSARLADSDTDFARLADVGSDRKRTASQANIDRPESSNSPCHINNRSPWKPRRRTHSEQSSVSGNSDNVVVPTTTTRTYKGNGNGNNNESNNATTTTTVFYVGDCHPYALHVRNRPQPQPMPKSRNNSRGSSDGEEQQAAQALMTLSSPGKSPKAAEALVTLSTSPGKPPKVPDYRCTQYLMSAIEESSSSGNSNASDSDNNSWRSDTPSLRSAEEYYNAMQLHHHHHHRQSSSAPNSPKDEGIVPDLLYPHHFNKKRRFMNARDVDEEDERAKYVTSQPTKARRDEFVQTTKAKRGRPPTYRRRSPSPLPMVHEDDEDEDDVSDDDDDDDDEDSNDPFGYGTSDGYGSDSGKMYICTWSAGNGEPPCGVTGTFNLVANHFTQRHNDKDEDMDFYVLEESEFRHYDYKIVRNVETKPTECGLPTKSHWDMVKPMSADPEYQMQVHRSQMAAHSAAAAAAEAAHAVVNGGREIIYLENGSLSPRDDASTRQTMSPPRPANKPIKARASQQQQRQFIINNINHHNNNNSVNANNNNHHMTKVNLVHINLGKMPQTTRRGRSDVKKCRKVYGMSHKELWCTQCKWKKACQRFHVPQPGAPQGAATTTATEISIAEHMNPR